MKLFQRFIHLSVLQVLLVSGALSASLLLAFYSLDPSISYDSREFPIRITEQRRESDDYYLGYSVDFFGDSSRVTLRAVNTSQGFALNTVDGNGAVEYNIHHDPSTTLPSFNDYRNLDVDNDGAEEFLIDMVHSRQGTGRGSITDADSVSLFYYGNDDRRELLYRIRKPADFSGNWFIINDFVTTCSGLPLNDDCVFVLLERGKADYYLHNRICVYEKGEPPSLLLKLPEGPPATYGLILNDKNGSRNFIFGMRSPNNGNKLLPGDSNPGDGLSHDTLYDSRGGVYRVDMQGNVVWSKAFGWGGGETYLYDQPGGNDVTLAIYKQESFMGQGSLSQSLFYWLDTNTGTILDSTQYAGLFVPFTGHNAAAAPALGLVIELNGTVKIIGKNGQPIVKYSDTISHSNNIFVPLLEVSGQYAYAMSSDSEYLVLRNLAAEPIGIYPGSGRLLMAKYGKGANEEDRLIFADSGTVYELGFTRAGFPFWWFWRYRWSIVFVLAPALVLLSIYFYLRYHDSQRRAMQDLKQAVHERTMDLQESNRSLESTSVYLESVFNNTGNGLLTLDPDGRVVRANDEFANMFNLKKELVESQPAESVGEGVLRPLLVAVYEHYDSNPQYVKYNGGRVFKASATQFQLPDETDPHVLLSVSDVSRLFQLEHETGDVNHAGFVGNSPAMQQVYRTINQLKHSESTVLILGESGVGKELVARAIHRSSVRGERPFIAVNCGAIDKHLQKSEMFGYVKGAFTGAVKNYTGYFEQADGGTLFLDELGDLAEDVQSLLLRVLEYGDYQRIGEEKVRTCNVRILAATNQPLQRLVKEGRFREDLYHRINVVQVHVPPLRERRSDISPLTHHFIEAIGSQMGKSVTGITHEALQRLESYSWPGNVRELKNVIEHALLFCREDVVDVRHLREEIQGLTVSPGIKAPQKHGEQSVDKSPDYTVKPTNEWDREYLVETLNRERWNKRKTATALGVSPQTLYKYLKRFSIE